MLLQRVGPRVPPPHSVSWASCLMIKHDDPGAPCSPSSPDSGPLEGPLTCPHFDPAPIIFSPVPQKCLKRSGGEGKQVAGGIN